MATAAYEASAFVTLGDTPKAIAAADRALELYDLRETTEPALVRFERASALVQAGDLDEGCRFAAGTVLDPRVYHSVTVRSRAQKFDTLLAMLVERDERYQAQRRPGCPARLHRGIEQATRAGTVTDGARDGADALHLGVPSASRGDGHRDRREMQQVVDE